MTTYKGVLHFYSETGTEGGYWAFQDEKFMGIPNGDRRCSRCGRIWSENVTDEPKPHFSYWVPEKGHYFGFDSPQDLPTGPPYSEFDQRSNERWNATSLLCYKLGHERWEPQFPKGMWSYEGLHTLKDGDRLTIFDLDHPDRKIWEGVVNQKQLDPMTDDAFGWRIHYDQVGIDRNTWAKWFMKEYPATLETAD